MRQKTNQNNFALQASRLRNYYLRELGTDDEGRHPGANGDDWLERERQERILELPARLVDESEDLCNRLVQLRRNFFIEIER